MSSKITGKISVNGVQLELESDNPQALSAVVSTIVSGKNGQRSLSQAEAGSSRPTAQDVRPVSSGKKSRRTRRVISYHPWHEQDVVGIGRIAKEHGNSYRGLLKKATRYLRESGMKKDRRRDSVEAMTWYVFRTIQRGDTKYAASKTIRALRDAGLIGAGARTNEPVSA